MVPRFKEGDRVFIRQEGVARVLGIQDEGDDQVYVLESKRGFPQHVPVSEQELSLREVADAETAKSMLALLRGDDVPLGLDGTSPHELMQRTKGVTDLGSALDHARFFRVLCAMPVPLSGPQKLALMLLEGLVIPEVAVALSLDEAALREELRQRYPTLRA